MIKKEPHLPIGESKHSPPLPIRLPYFDYLLSALKSGNLSVEKSFGRHVHWGYWKNPQQAELTTDDFVVATEELSRQICKVAQLHNHLRVLDVGCGFGGTIAYINENYHDMNLVGLNLDERQLIRAREIVSPLQSNNITFRQGNACDLPFPDACFDIVLAVECIFHFPDREQFFNEAYRVLKPGGFLALSDFVPKKALLPFARLKLNDRLTAGFYGKCNILCSTDDYRRLTQKTNFTMTTERDITTHTLPTYRYLRRLNRQYPVGNIFALLETLTAEVLSKSGLLKYYLYGFQKSPR